MTKESLTIEQVSQIGPKGKGDLLPHEIWADTPPDLDSLTGVIPLDVPPTAKKDKLISAAKEYFLKYPDMFYDAKEKGKEIIIKNKNLIIGAGVSALVIGAGIILLRNKSDKD